MLSDRNYYMVVLYLFDYFIRKLLKFLSRINLSLKIILSIIYKLGATFQFSLKYNMIRQRIFILYELINIKWSI